MSKTLPVKANFLQLLQITVLSILLLYFGQSLFIPLSFALLVSFMLYPICHWLEGRGVSRTLAIGISLSGFFILLAAVVGLLVYQFTLFTREWPALSAKITYHLDQLGAGIDDLFQITTAERQSWIKSFTNDIFQNTLSSLPKAIYDTSISTVLLLLVPFYTALILYYRNLLITFLYKLFPASRHADIKVLLPETVHTYFNFIKGMSLVYLIVGVLNSIGLALLGIPNPIFFGFIASILTFIPYVGITVGALLPMSVAWLTYDSIWYPMGVVGIFVFVQILEANVIFPLAVSYKLKLNALVAITVIIAGGILWGAAGLILFLPFVAIFKLIADRIDDLEPIATLLGVRVDAKAT